MNLNLTTIFHLLIILGSLFSIIYTCGVVWRVEKRLDTAFKLLLVAIIFFSLSELLDFFQLLGVGWFSLLSLLLRVIFIVFFLIGILETRSMIRRMDGEIGRMDGEIEK